MTPGLDGAWVSGGNGNTPDQPGEFVRLEPVTFAISRIDPQPWGVGIRTAGRFGP